MKLIVLGSKGPLPLPGDACSSYLLEDEGHFLLVDAGSGSLSHLLEYTALSSLDAVVLSHLHFDHMSDALVMQYSLTAQPLPLYAPLEPAGGLAQLLSFGGFRHTPTAPGNVADIAGWRLFFGPARHPVPCTGIRVERGGRVFGYTGDSNDCPEQTEFFRGADFLLADAGMAPEAWKEASPHRTPEMCGKLAAEARVKRLMITHFGPTQDPALAALEAEKAFGAPVLCARAHESARV